MMIELKTMTELREQITNGIQYFPLVIIGCSSLVIILNIQLMSFLGNTKKMATVDGRKSAKLPKLTIQQQIDNNEVIQRMNRKVTFTKNQRHLGKTMQYAEAIENHASGTIFSVQPERLLFTDYTVGKTYESEIRLVNRSKHIQRIKITPLQKRQFVISNVKYPRENTGDIAPGMQVSIMVRFKPTNLHDNFDELIVIVGDGVVRVPIKAERQKCKGQWPSKLECGHCWVGDRTEQQIKIANDGGQALFKLKGATSDMHEIGFFKVWPTEIKICKKADNIINVDFLPRKQGLFQERIVYTSDQADEDIQIVLEGGAYTAHITLNEMNNQKLKQQKFHNFLYLNNCEPGKVSTSSFKVQNHAVVPVDYFWHFQTDPSLTIEQPQGKINPSDIITFQISYSPTSRAPKKISAFLYLYNLPKQSILTDSPTKKINGVEAIECLRVDIKTSSMQSATEVSPLHRKIVQPLYTGHFKEAAYKIKNNSETVRKFWVALIKNDQFTQASYDESQNSQLKAGEEKEIKIKFRITELSQDILRAYFLVNFDNAPSKMISVEGRVQYPNLRLFSTDIDFSLLRTNSVYRTKFDVFNDGENPIRYKIQNPNRYYLLDFYDFYEFEDEQYYKDRLKITTSIGEVCEGWMEVPPQTTTTIQFQLHTSQPESVMLACELVVENGPTYHLGVQAQVQSIDAKMSQNSINMKKIYKGNVYNSNKFLSRELSILNTGNLDLNYQIIAPNDPQCKTTITQMSGVIAARSKKRLDLIIEPIKTGDFAAEFSIQYFDNIPLFSEDYAHNTIAEFVPSERKSFIKSESLKIQAGIKGIQISYFIKDQSRAKKVRQKFEEGQGSVKVSNYSFKSGTKSQYLEADKLIYPALEEINFYNCEINKVRQIEIIIENQSGLTTEFEVFAEMFKSDEKSETKRSNAKGLMQSEQEAAFTSEMGKTFIQNRVLDKAQKVHLSNNKGISIMCEPASGFLHKKQSQTIVVTMFNDTSGKFRDNLLISIKDHEVKKIPINMQIKGTPVSLSRNQLAINFNAETPTLNTGIFLAKNGKSTRNIKIVNNGPKEVFLKWVFYPCVQQAADKDLFQINFQNADSGAENLVNILWKAIKPDPVEKCGFSISPMEKTLKGRQESNFILTIEESTQIGEFKNLLIGEPFMVDGAERRPMEELAVVLEGQSVLPRLSVDQKHQNHINKFERFAIAGNEDRTKAQDYHRKIKLKNRFKCNVSFTLEIETVQSSFLSFEIVHTDTDSPMNKLKQKTLGSSMTKMQGTIKDIQKQFTLPYESFVQIGINLNGNPKNFTEWPMEKKVRKDGILRIIYSNGQIQQIRLAGWLYRPWIEIEMPNHQLHSIQNCLIDFGTVHVKNHKKMSFYIFNPTKSAADWTITYVKYQQSKKIIFEKKLWTALDYEDETITDEKKCFRLSQDSGHILAQSIPVHYMPTTLALAHEDDKYAETHKPTKIDFLFKPESNILYKSKFLLAVEHGPTYEIIVRGSGTFEEQKQKK